MSFAREVKEEIINTKMEDKYLKIILSAIFNNSKNPNTILSSNGELLHFIETATKKLFGIEGSISKYNLRLYQLNYHLDIDINAKINEKNNLEVSFYLAGLFLLTGSVNSPISPQYHLEVTPLNETELNKIVKMMKKFYLDPKVITRREKKIIYLKKSDQISDFLSVIHAETKMLEFENIRIERDFYNSTTRVNNCEISNGIKTIETAKKQIDFINKVGLSNLEDNLYIVARLRLKYVDLNLNDLAEVYFEETGKRINKSSLSYLFKQIEIRSKNEKRY